VVVHRKHGLDPRRSGRPPDLRRRLCQRARSRIRRHACPFRLFAGRKRTVLAPA
jgi:hypothetical protein